MDKLFEKATRGKMRFPYKGWISAEELWDLSQKDLDSVYKTLVAQNKTEKNEESLLVEKSAAETELDVKIEIVKYIFEVKKMEAANRALEKENKEKIQKILAIKERRSEQALENATDEELNRMLAELKQ